MNKSIRLLLLTMLLVSACSANPTRTARSAKTETPLAPPPASTKTPTPAPSPTEEPTLAPTATTAPASATLAQDTICRLGPGDNYYKMITELKGETVEPRGRNEDSTWVVINENAYDETSPLCWLPVSAFANPSNLDGLSVADYELLPPGPFSITAPNGVCGSNKPMIVEWSPVVDGVEYRLYRDWKPVSTQTGGKYYDVNLPDKGKAVTFTYMVQAINDYGTSPSVAVSITYCGK